MTGHELDAVTVERFPSSLVLRSVGMHHRVDMPLLVSLIDEGSISAEMADVVVRRLRELAHAVESEVVALRESSDRVAQRVHREAQREDRVIAERVSLPLVHGSRGGVGVLGRVLRVLRGGARKDVLRHDFPLIGAADVPSSAVSDPIVGDASGVGASPQHSAPDAHSGAKS